MQSSRYHVWNEKIAHCFRYDTSVELHDIEVETPKNYSFCLHYNTLSNQNGALMIFE